MPKLDPAQSAIRRAAQKVATTFIGVHPHVTGVSMTYSPPRIIIHAKSDSHKPPNFPKHVSVPIGGGRSIKVAMHWYVPRTQGVPLAQSLFAGAPPVEDRPVTITADYPALEVPTNAEAPPGEEPYNQLVVPTHLPPFITPNFWAKPFFDAGEICISRWETDYVVNSVKVPYDYTIIVNGISYEFVNCLQQFDQFDVSVFRDLTRLTIIRDMLANPSNPDPAYQYAFGGNVSPIPTYCRFPSGSVVTSNVRVKGPFPFAHTPNDVLGGCARVFLRGWMSSEIEYRDTDAPGVIPVDLGAINNLALGDVPP